MFLRPGEDDRETNRGKDPEMTTIQIHKNDLYVGAGNVIDLKSGERFSTVGQRDDAVEVVFYVNPNTGERVNAPYVESERKFKWVNKMEIVAVNGEPIHVFES